MAVSKPENQRFSSRQRVKSSIEFDRIWKSRLYAADQVLIINAIDRADGQLPRIGLSIGRRYGNAVQRNYWKRVVREVFRKNSGLFPAGADLVVRPRSGGDRPDYSTVERSLLALAARLAQRLRR